MGSINKRLYSGGAEKASLERFNQSEGPPSGSSINHRESLAPAFKKHHHDDPYLRPAFTFWNRIRRALWTVCWALLFRPTPVPFFWWRSFILRRFGASVGPRNFIYPSTRIWAPWLLETGAVVTIGRGTEIYNPGGVVFKHHSIVSQDAYICGASHDYNDQAFSLQSKLILLEPYGWICARAIVLPGVTVGEGSILGAGSVTARSLDPWWVYAGNPAKRVKPRNQTRPV